ncbi:MAG: DUF3592 domain-containing protein [Acidobacteria bacterium]|nr:DUF3592 domain-containing protein [Acidobacteriota bacterium]
MNKWISLCRFFRVPLLALGLVMAGAGLFYLAVPKLIISYHNQTWPSVVGQIVDSRWQNKLVSQNAARPNFKFTPKIEYSYIVDNTEYKGTTISLTSYDELDRQLGKTKLEQYPTGRRVSVYYDPRNPGVSCLEQEKPTLIGVLGAIMGVVSFYIAFALIRQVVKS